MWMRSLFFSAFALLAFLCRAQEGQFFHISLEQGLSDGRVRAIVQDHHGFMWFGTANGLNRYDGYNFKVYLKETSNLQSNNIYSLFKTRKGDIWIGTANGVYVYNPKLDDFFVPKGLDTLTRNYLISYMSEDERGRMYIGSYRGIFRYHPETGLLEDLNQTWKAPRKIYMVSGLTWSDKKTLWLSTQNLGFFKVDTDADTLTPIMYDTEFGDSCCYAMHETALVDDQYLLAAMHSYGLGLLDMNALKFYTVPGVLGKPDSVRYNTVHAIIRDHKGRVWVGSEHFGLVQYMHATRQVVQYKYDPFNPYSYGGQRVLALYEDREHNIWIGTGGYGVYRFNPDHNVVRYIAWNPAGVKTPPGPEVMGFGLRDSNSVWIGTNQGPAIFNFKTTEFISYKSTSSFSGNKPGNNIISCFVDKDGIVWFGCRNLGLSRFDPKTGKFSRFIDTDKPYSLPNNLAYNIMQQPDGMIMLQFSTRIGLLDPKTFRCYTNKTDSTHPLMQVTMIKDYCKDKYGNLLIGKQDGAKSILKYDFATRTVTKLAELDTSSEVRLNMIRAMDDEIACATTQGIFVLDEQGKLRKYYTNETEILRNNITGLITDIPGYIWFCTDRYIGRLELATGKWQWLGTGDGLKPTKFFETCFNLLPNGKIIAGSIDGLFIIDPKEFKATPSFPPYLVSFRIFDHPLNADTSLQDLQNIKLSYTENFFSFDISSFSYQHGNSFQYAYMLEGFDKDWQYIGNNRSGSYTNVPGGDYTLMFKARSATGDWVISPQKIKIHIGKPFWKTWLFRIAVLLALLGIVYALYRYRFNEVRRRAKLKADYEIKLNELEISALRTQMNPHFIFNCLNTINSFINSNQKAQANQYITRFARLIRLILENSRQRRVPLSDELEALDLYIQLEQLRFENRFGYHLLVSDEIDQDNVEVPPLIIQPFVENAILHGILPKEGTGVIEIFIDKTEGVLRYKITDDGIGREEAKRRQKAGMLKKQSHGMNITLKRIELFNKENNQNGGVFIDDVMGENGVAGTTVEIRLAYVEGF